MTDAGVLEAAKAEINALRALVVALDSQVQFRLAALEAQNGSRGHHPPRYRTSAWLEKQPEGDLIKAACQHPTLKTIVHKAHLIAAAREVHAVRWLCKAVRELQERRP